MANALWVNIDYNSPEPISHQVIAQIKLMVVNGTLKPGTQMPSIREFAKSLKVNPTTIARIYNDLSHEGILTLRQGQGAFISETGVRLSADEVRRRVGEQAQTLLVEGLRLGLSVKEIQKIVNEEFEEIRNKAHE